MPQFKNVKASSVGTERRPWREMVADARGRQDEMLEWLRGQQGWTPMFDISKFGPAGNGPMRLVLKALVKRGLIEVQEVEDASTGRGMLVRAYRVLPA